jgi:hypothetical protein
MLGSLYSRAASSVVAQPARALATDPSSATVAADMPLAGEHVLMHFDDEERGVHSLPGIVRMELGPKRSPTTMRAASFLPRC